MSTATITSKHLSPAAAALPTMKADNPVPSEHFNGWPNALGFDINHEERSPIELKVTGTIPAYAAGTLYRTGPGGYQIKTETGETYSARHWFDGFTQVHRFQIVPPPDSQNCTQVLYNSRHQCDEYMERIRQTGKLDDFSFAQGRDPCLSYFKKVMSVFSTSQRGRGVSDTNIGVTVSINPPALGEAVAKKHGREPGHASGVNTLFTKTDGVVFQQTDAETLEPIGYASQSRLHPDLKGQMSCAHAKSDPITGDVYNFNLEIGALRTTYRIFRLLASTGQAEIIGSVDGAPAAYLHSFFLTENHVLLCVWGSHLAMGGMKVALERNVFDAISDYDPSKKAKWYVFDRKHGNGLVASYESDNFFAFHAINAWEEPSATEPDDIDIVADIPAFENLDCVKRFFYDNIKSTGSGAAEYALAGAKGASSRPFLRRYRLPTLSNKTAPKTTTIDWTAPRDSSGELPTINPKYFTKPTRYVYANSDRGKSSFLDGLVKYDAHTHTAVFWQHHGQSPGEAIFIPDPAGHAEDDGVLLSVVLDGMSGKSYLLVLDARTMQEVGRASMDIAMSFGFHGSHVAPDGTGTYHS